MNSRLHAEHSAQIFGGKPEQYLAIHEMIDGNKVASSSIFGRFFMHHYDIGGEILYALFGKTIKVNSKIKVDTKEILLQHLIEDYDQIPVLQNWMSAFGTDSTVSIRMNLHIQDDVNEIKNLLSSDQYLSGLSTAEIKKIESVIGLAKFTKDPMILESKVRYMVFGHATGLHLAEKILGEKIGKFWTLDVLTRYYEYKFDKGIFTHKDVPNLLQWAEKIEDKEWMHAPKDYDRFDAKYIKKRMIEIKKSNTFGIPAEEKEEERETGMNYHRTPCNLD